MATNYQWTIPTLEYYPSLDGLNQVVHNIHWVLSAENSGYKSTVYGTQSLKTDTVDPNKFIAYANLTQQVVEQWLEQAMGAAKVQELKTILQTNIDNMISPPNVISNPPWAAPTTTL